MRILFVAISNITVCDTTLLDLGLTLPGFVKRSKAIASLPNLGLLTLAGQTPPPHETLYREVASAADFEQLPRDGVDLVAIASFTALIHQAYALSEKFREKGVKTVLGGLHATMEPEEALQHADAVVAGEGESVWPQILDDLAAGRLGGLYDARSQEFDLREAPAPAFSLLEQGRYNRLTVQVSRGCPLKCEFCASSILLTRKYKYKPIHKVLAELDALCALFGRPFIEFVDDNAFRDKAYWRELMPALKARRLRWFAETDASVAQDGDFLRQMRDSGCYQVLIGLESPDEAARDRLELTSNWKRRPGADDITAIAAIQGAGVRVIGCFIVGLDGHRPDIFGEIEAFSEASGLFDVQVTLPTAFPGTPFAQRLEAEGRLLAPRDWRSRTLFDVNFTPRGMSVAALTSGFRDLVGSLYSEPASRRRSRAFHRMAQAGAAREAAKR